MVDRSSIETFVRNDYPRVVAAVAFSCGDRHRAEDAVQEVLASLLDNDVDVRSMTAWTVTAALNRVRSTERSRSAERRAHDRLQARRNGSEAELGSVDDEVIAALRQLPQRQRDVIALHYLLDMSVDTVAAVLDITAGTVKTQLHRGRDALRTQLTTAAADRSSEEPDDVHR